MTVNGRPERLRCRVSYAIAPSDTALQQNLVCASDSYRFDIASNVIERGGRLSGQWTERSRNIVGNVTGTINGNRINTQVEATGFSANLTLTTNGNRQTVLIRPRNYEISEIALSLVRSR